MNYSTMVGVNFTAAKTAVACITLNSNGSMCATASEKGTLIRIWNTTEGTLMQTLRRGVDRAEIYCINFDPRSHWIVATSDKGTVHIYALQASGFRNTKSSMSFMSKIIPKYFESEFSYAQFRVADSRMIAAFSEDSQQVIVLSAEGKYYRATFNPNAPGEASLQISEQLIEIEN